MPCLALTANRDWFTYSFKIDNIDELIKAPSSSSSSSSSSSTTQQQQQHHNCIQSPIFSFRNHLVNNADAAAAAAAAALAAASASKQPTNTPPTTSTQASSTSPLVDTNTNNTSNNTSHSDASGCSSGGGTSGKLDATLTDDGDAAAAPSGAAKKTASNWRLIFYPNGAGPDCRDFLSIFLKYLSDEPVKVQMMFSIVDNNNQDVYVKYTANRFCQSNDWGFKQLIHRNAILYQRDKFLRKAAPGATFVAGSGGGAGGGGGGGGGTLTINVKMRLDEQRSELSKRFSDSLHYCKLLSDNFNQSFYTTSSSSKQSSPSSLSALSSSNTQLQASDQSAPTLTPPPTPTTTTTSQKQSVVGGGGGKRPHNHQSTTQSHAMKQRTSTLLATQLRTTAQALALSSSSLVTSHRDEMIHVEGGASPQSAAAAAAAYFDLLILVKKDNEDGEGDNDGQGQGCEDGHQQQQQQQQQQRAAKRVKLCSSDEGKNKSKYVELRAHKCMLAARSPVFKAMFDYRLSERATNRVHIEDCRPEVVRLMLKYVYTARLSGDELAGPLAIDLYVCAEKYMLDALKIKCREHLAASLCGESVIHTFILSEIYNDSMLRKQTLKYIGENIEKIAQNPEWNDFMLGYPQYFTNAFIRLCKKDF